MTETVLVTGGAGYVGSHICLATAEAGYHPVSVDDLSGGHRRAVRFGPFEHLDIRARELGEVVARHRPIAIVHAAAESEVAASFRDAVLYHQVNVLGTRNVVRACRAAGVRHLVMISSAAVYGSVGVPLVDEGVPTRPMNPYGMTKLGGEAMLADPNDGHRSWAALRLFNVAGAAPDAGLGEDHAVETHLIPLALRAALGKSGPLALYGTTYPTADGSAVRDYVHVVDVAAAVLLALDYLRAGGASRVFNVGSGTGTSVFEVVRAVERVAGQRVPVRLEDGREGDPATLVADTALAGRSLGFRPSASRIDTIVADALAWATTAGTRWMFASSGPRIASVRSKTVAMSIWPTMAQGERPIPPLWRRRSAPPTIPRILSAQYLGIPTTQPQDRVPGTA